MINIILTSLFISFLLRDDLNIGYYLRKWLGIRISKSIKILDCFPCFSFWISILVSICFLQISFAPLFVFVFGKIYETIEKR